jgi:hypothetical protein
VAKKAGEGGHQAKAPAPKGGGLLLRSKKSGSLRRAVILPGALAGLGRARVNPLELGTDPLLLHFNRTHILNIIHDLISLQAFPRFLSR